MGENIVGKEIVFDSDQLLDRILKMVKCDEELSSESEDDGTEACFRMKNELARMLKKYETEVSNEQENLNRKTEEVRLMKENFTREDEECDKELLQLEQKVKKVMRRKCKLEENLTEEKEKKRKNKRNLEDLTEKWNKAKKMEAVRQKMEDFAEEKRKLKMEMEALKKTIANLNRQHDESQRTIKALHVVLKKEKRNVAEYKTALDKARDEKEEDAQEILKLNECLRTEQCKTKSLQESNEKLSKFWNTMGKAYMEMNVDMDTPSTPYNVGESDGHNYGKVLASSGPAINNTNSFPDLSSSDKTDEEQFQECPACLKPFHCSIYMEHLHDCNLNKRDSDEDTQSNPNKRKLSELEWIDESENAETLPQSRTKRILNFKESQPEEVSGYIGEGEGEGGGDHPPGVTVAAVSEEPRPSGSKYELRTRGLSCSICRLNGKCPKHG